MPRRAQPAVVGGLPPTLRLLIKAAEHECPRGHAEALADFTVLALRKVPSRGIFDPGTRDEHELFSEIESVTKAHFDLTNARTEWHNALETAGLAFEHRDDIETAALRVQSISDTGYFYAGLAFGLAFLALGRPS